MEEHLEFVSQTPCNATPATLWLAPLVEPCCGVNLAQVGASVLLAPVLVVVALIMLLLPCVAQRMTRWPP